MTHRKPEAPEGAHMLQRLRRRLSYANVMSTLAVFIALGGYWLTTHGASAQSFFVLLAQQGCRNVL